MKKLVLLASLALISTPAVAQDQPVSTSDQAIAATVVNDAYVNARHQCRAWLKQHPVATIADAQSQYNTAFRASLTAGTQSAINPRAAITFFLSKSNGERATLRCAKLLNLPQGVSSEG